MQEKQEGQAQREALRGLQPIPPPYTSASLLDTDAPGPGDALHFSSAARVLTNKYPSILNH